MNARPRSIRAALAAAALVGVLLSLPLGRAQEAPSADVPASRGDAGIEARVASITSRLTQGHKALSALDMAAARAIDREMAAGGEEIAGSLAVRFFRARAAFFDHRYRDGLAFLGEQQADGDPPEVLKLRAMLSNLVRITADFKERQTEHFVIAYRPGADEVLLPYLEETLELSWQAIGSELGHHPEEKVRLEIFPTSDDFIAVSGLTRKEIETTGIIALCVYNKLMITSPRALALGYRWLDTASHEYIHQVVALRSGNEVPVWLQEGLAKFFEVRWRGGRSADLSPMSENLLAEALASGNFVPFERMTPSVAKLSSQEEAQLAFAQVETFIEYMVQTRGLPGIRELMEKMRKGLSDQEAVAAVMGQPFPQVEAAWRRFVAEKRPQRLPGVEMMPIILQAQQLQKGEEAQEKVTDPFLEENKAMQEFTRLGDLLRARGRHQAALIEYKKAAAASPRESPALQVKMAQAHVELGDLGGARKVLEALVERYDGFAPAWTYLGEVYMLLGLVPDAIKALEEANASNPFDPTPHLRLAELYQRQGDSRRAEREKAVLALLMGG